MIKQTILFSVRNIKRNKISFFINLVGLSTGLTCALLICLWVNDELNTDKFNENDSQLYQVMQNLTLSDEIKTMDYTPAPLTDALLQEMPEVEYAVPVCNYYHRLRGILLNSDIQIQSNGLFAGKDFFHVFSFDLIQGYKNQVLADKSSVVISEKLAKKLFRTTENVIGKTLVWNSYWKRSFRVSGVFADVPSNSTTQFDFLLNFDVLLDNDGGLKGWGSEPAYTYLILKKGTNIHDFNIKIADFIKLKPSREHTNLFVQQYSKRYLYGTYENGVQASGRIAYVRLFSIIGLIILIIACINFMNLSTAKAGSRMREVGIKKATGARRINLISQFMSESVLMAFLSLLIAILLVSLLLPHYNEITGKHLHLNFTTNIILSFLGITVFSGIVAGSYPAFYLSGFKPAKVLKGKLSTSFGELWLRKGLVISQFVLSVIFIVVLLVIRKQIEYVKNKNLGYNKENVICFRCNARTNMEFVSFMKELRNIPEIKNATNIFGGNILENISSGIPPTWEGQTTDPKIITPKLLVDDDFIETLGIELLAGRSFSKEYGNEWSKVILNESAAKMVGFSNPIGKFLREGNNNLQIIGIVKDFHIKSLHKKIEPCFIRFEPYGRDILVKITAGDESATINRISKLVEKFQPGYPLEFSFLDKDYQALYKSEYKIAALTKYFAGIAIIISCLGLFGLVSFTVERRRKEIGVRKVMGSNSIGIINLIAGDFTKLVLLSIMIALPISYSIVHYWLNNYAYRIDLEWYLFVSAGFIAIFIAWITIGLQALNAANINPAQCLKDE